MSLPIHFFTIVLNGDPFLRWHLPQMLKLKCDWHYHIIEGAADLVKDTAWSKANGASIPAEFVKDGLSVDGTTAYLDEIAQAHPDCVTIYRKGGGALWDGKQEMVNAPLPNLPDECLLWQVDSDELWTAQQFETMRAMFEAAPERMAAVFFCHYFVGPNLVIDRRHKYPEIEWRRVWRYRKGMTWLAHEPPVLGILDGECRYSQFGGFADVATIKPFHPCETEAAGLVFDHMAYVTEEQVKWKARYYGYENLLNNWRLMQANYNSPRERHGRFLKRWFPYAWVHPDAMLLSAYNASVPPRMEVTSSGEWNAIKEWNASEENNKAREYATPTRGVVFMHWGTNTAPLQRAVESVKRWHPELPITILQPEGTPDLLVKARMGDLTPYDETLFLDADTVVLGRLDFGFAMARKHGLACCICEAPWARRYGGIGGDLVEYNTGVLFWTRAAKSVMDYWRDHAHAVDSSILFHRGEQLCRMPINDQAAFALAVAQWDKAPFVLPLNWNFRPQWHRSWWGQIKVWHDYADVPPAVLEWNAEQTKPGAVVRYAEMRNNERKA